LETMPSRRTAKLLNHLAPAGVSSSDPEMAGAVPIIDLQGFLHGDHAAKQAVAMQIGRACEDIGFFLVKNHGIDQGLIDRVWATTEDFFREPVAVKNIPMTEDYPYGYSGFQEETLAAGKESEEGATEFKSLPDLKECFSIGPYNDKAGMPSIRWPSSPSMFSQDWLDYYKAMEDLSSRLLSAFALALHLPEEWFNEAIDAHRCALRALSYPPLPSNATLLPGQIRAGAHTDYGSLTILRQDGTGGLQVLNKQEQWQDVVPTPGTFVINLGDLMSRWTNGKWVSTLHRVVNPPDCQEGAAVGGRQSMAFFHNINADHVVECIPTCTSTDNPPKYPPITAFEHLMQKHLAATGGK